MVVKDLIEIIAVIISIGGSAATGAFAFATSKYLLEIKELHQQVKNEIFDNNKETLRILGRYVNDIRKLQQNNDNLLAQLGRLKCEVTDIQAVLQKRGLLHDRVGFPDDFIPKRTDWNIEDA